MQFYSLHQHLGLFLRLDAPFLTHCPSPKADEGGMTNWNPFSMDYAP